MKLQSFLRLIRLPNVFTAGCNSLAGAFFVGVTFDRWPELIAVATISMSIYAAGILLNDLFDLEEDRIERPERPLPSGAVPIRLAYFMVSVFIFGGVLIAGLLSTEVFITAMPLMAFVDSYNQWGKKTVLGPWLMGMCRGYNFGLGLSLVPLGFFTWTGIIAMLGYTFYISGITYISRQETKTGETKGLRQGFILLIAGMAMVIAAMLFHSNRTIYGFDIQNDVPLLGGLLILMVLMKRLTTVWKTAFAEPRPETIQNVVKTGIINLPLIDFAIVLAAAGPLATIPIVILFSLARLTARKLYTT
jgi:4-hydroxybenzoate polyprenyltransferase